MTTEKRSANIMLLQILMSNTPSKEPNVKQFKSLFEKPRKHIVFNKFEVGNDLCNN